MDSIENRSLTDVATQEAAEVLAVTEVIATPIQSKEEVITRLQAINQQEELADKTELDTLKQTFYRLRNAEVEAAQKAFEEFDIEKAGSKGNVAYGKGVYFTPDKEVADRFGSKTKEAYLNIENPYIIQTEEQLLKNLNENEKDIRELDRLMGERSRRNKERKK